ncbi:MAG: xanthine dehydrogenase family protein subunit M, partial [Chloroflexota bacterium]|nr:xanthine dehydrogenase family protein subunit M [Chloroflexota bacterium]
MFPSAFEYYTPTSLLDAVRLLGSGNKVIAGGHSLLPLMKLRLAEPAGLVDIRRVPGLDGIAESGGVIHVGARATYAAIMDSAVLQAKAPLLCETAARIGDLQVRNRGTIGGSLAHADPAGDLPAAILALDAELVATGPGGERTIPAGSFFTGMLSTALSANEILTEIRVRPLPPRTGTCYQKFPHPASRYALVGVAAVITLGNDGTVAQAAIGVTGLADHAFRATAAEQALLGKAPDQASARAAAVLVDQGQDALGDIHA